jgi:trimeric autotransporter adhesin
MHVSSALRTLNKFSLGLIALISLTLVACGGGGGGTSSNNPPTRAEVEAITDVQIATYSSAQIVALGTNIQYLSNQALGAMLNTQVSAITATEIGALSPAQVRLIGSKGAGGATTTSKITSLNAGAWAALVGNPTQVAAITAAEVAKMSVTQIPVIGINIQHFSNAALGAFVNGFGSFQVDSITAAQIAVLSPAQVRFIGSPDGSTITPSKIAGLNTGAWAQLVSDPLQVAEIQAIEVPTLSITKIPAIGINIQSLSNAALGAFVNGFGSFQVDSITPAQIAVLSPAQVRFIGSPDGSTITPSKIAGLNVLTWAQLVNSQAQVEAITAAEVHTLSVTKIPAIGINIQFLSNAALGAFVNGFGSFQVDSITAAQIAVLLPAKIRFIGSPDGSTITPSKIAGLNVLAWAQLVSDQLQVVEIQPIEIPTLSSTKIVAFGTNIQYLSIPAKGALTAAQLAAMTPAQHTACGC